MNPDEVREEIKRLEDERLRLALGVMGGNPGAVEEDRGLERRIMELAGSGREIHTDEPLWEEGKNRPGGTG